MNARTLLTALVLLAVATTSQATPPADTDALLSDAWKAWEQGDQRTVEAKFKEVLAKDPTSSRAHLGLTLLYQLQRRTGDAFVSFQKGLEHVSDRHPYIYANWYDPMLSGVDAALDLKRSLAERAESTGVLKAMANEVIGAHRERRNDLEGAREHYGALDAVVDWMMIGPFDNTSASGHRNVYAPEAAFDAAGTYKGKSGVRASWFRPAALRLDRWIDFTRSFVSGDAVFYANSFVYSPERRRVQMRIGTSGSFRLFLNDEVLLDESTETNNDLDTYVAETELQKGWNRILVKCGMSEIDRCNFLLRLTDERGEPLAGTKYSTDAQTYTSKPGAPVRSIENFAEAFFRARIAEHPDHLENYLLLAGCYLRNDKATEAELTLRDALRRAPKSVVLLDRQLEAFVRGRKYDEVQTTLERIHGVDPHVPSAMEYRFNEHMSTEEYEEAEKVLRDLETALGEAESVLAMKLRLLGAKEQGEQVVALVEKAARLYPRSSQFLMVRAYLDAQTTNSSDGSISLLEEYLDEDYDPSTARALASLYLQTKSDVARWRAINERLLELDPASPGYLFDMANTYFSAQKYDEARSLMKRAMAICPGAAGYWSRLGEIERIEGNRDEAITAFRTALAYQPTDYDTRAKLRELEGKRSIFEQIPPQNIDSIIAAAPSAEQYPDEKGMILVDDSRRIVYAGGASEASQEYVVKLFNNLAIDDWKEYWIGYNGYSEELIVEKAVAIDAEGDETKADVDGGHLVFKSLEPGDIIHIKWRTKNHYAGRLAEHFWDSYYFNDDDYPVRDASYALLVPKDFEFRHVAQNMEAAPSKRDVEDGVLYEWRQRDLPAISYEYGMPAYADVSKALHISSIRDWAYLVEWYRDLARSKTEASFEVKEAVAELMKGRENASVDEKTRAVYEYITENVRYSSVPFRQGSHIPQKARDVLVTRIGDCKDVATLCIAMLSELGITSHHVLVNTRDEGLNSVVLPSIPFNHCIVGVEEKGGIRYLDLTANNFPYGSLPEGDRGAFMLLIKPGVTAPEYLPSRGQLPRNLDIAVTVDLGADNALAAERRLEGTGALAASIRGAFRDESKRDQEKGMTASLGEEFPNARLVSFETSNIDRPLPTAGYVYRFEVPEYLNDAGTFKMMKLPWLTSAGADQALSYESREHAYDYWPSADTISERLVITLPETLVPVELPAKQELTSPIADYSISYAMSGRTLTATRRYIYKKGVVAPGEYEAYKSFYNTVIKEDNRQILLKSGGAAPGRRAEEKGRGKKR